LAGCSVYDESGEKLGILTDVLPTKSNDVWVVVEERHGRKSELLVPALKTVVKEVDTAGKKITVALPEGLREAAPVEPSVPAPDEGFED
jgi:16S rRNA processing protein RimM